MHCLELLYCKNYSELAKIFILRQTIQNAPGLNRGLPSNFWWLRSVNHMKSLEECVMYTENPILVQRIFTNRLNMRLAQAWHEKAAHWVETDSPVKKKFWGQFMLTVFLRYTSTLDYWFLWKRYKCKQCDQLPNPRSKFCSSIEETQF